MKAWLSGWFYGLQPRERWIVATGALLFVVIVGWGLVVSPLRAETARLQTSVNTNQRLLVEVSRVQREQRSTPPGEQPGRDQPLSYLVSNTVGTYGLEAPRARANGGNGVDVTFQSASFDAIVAWLAALHDSYGVDVETASLTPAREPGFVNATLLLRRP